MVLENNSFYITIFFINQTVKGIIGAFPCNHGTIIQTGISCKRGFCYICNSAYRWLIVKNAEIFQSYVKDFWILPSEKNCRILTVSWKWVIINHPIMLLDRYNKTKLVPSSFSYFLELLRKKINSSLKIVIVINVINFLHVIKKLIKLFYLHCFILEKSNKENLKVIRNTLNSFSLVFCNSFL